MSLLVYWTYDSSKPLSKGWIPNGLTHSDFNGGFKSIDGKYVAEFNGNPADISLYGMSLYTPPEYKVYNHSIMSIDVGGQPAQGLGNTYYGAVGTTISLSAEILDDSGNRVVGIDQDLLGYPPVLKMPMIKMVGGINGTVVDEVYFNVTLQDGVLTAEGSLPSSGDWKITSERLNQAIKAINGDWSVNSFVINFLV